MPVCRLGPLALVAMVVLSCSPPPPATPAPPPTEDEVGHEAPADETTNTEAATRLTGLVGVDAPLTFAARILDARGTGRLGGEPLVAGRTAPLTPGRWLLGEAGSEYEVSLKGPLLSAAVVRLAGESAFLLEVPDGTAGPRFRVFGGTASFYLPKIPAGNARVLTPVGWLATQGAVFTVTVAPDSQVLITCREGRVDLTGPLAGMAAPGQVLVVDPLGRHRTLAMTPNEAQVFADRWLKVATEESGPRVAGQVARQLALWNSTDGQADPEGLRALALWFRAGRSVAPGVVPSAEFWAPALVSAVVSTAWVAPRAPVGLLGVQP